MRRPTIFLSLLFTCLVATAEEEAKPIMWPPGVEAKIDEALAIKKEAFKKSPTMRDPGGPSAAAFGKCLDEIAASPPLAGLEPELRKHEGTDLKAKIALWAVDRQHRPAEYSRIAADYVDKPDGALPLHRPIVIRPRAVSDADCIPDCRLPLEHAFFAPPAGLPYEPSDGYRQSLAEGLGEIHDDRSQIVFKTDLRMQTEAWPDDRDPHRMNPVCDYLVAVHRFRTAGCFPVIALNWDRPLTRKAVMDCLAFDIGPIPKPGRPSPDPEKRPPTSMELYDRWQQIASLPWETENEKSLAAYIKSLPRPAETPDRHR